MVVQRKSESHKEKMERKKVQRNALYNQAMIVTAGVNEIFSTPPEDATTNKKLKVWKDMRQGYLLLAMGRNPRWIKRLLGLNKATMKGIYDVANTQK